MTEPTHWPRGGEAETAEEVRAAELLGQVRPRPWSAAAKLQVLRQVREELARPAGSSRLRWGLLALTATAAAALLAVGLRRPGPPAGAAPEVVAAAGADYSWLPAEGDMLGLVIRTGSIEVHPRSAQQAIAVHTPSLEARVEAEVFQVKVAAEVTTLSIGEGQAWVGKTVHLHRHETIRSDDPRLKQRAPPPSPAAPAAQVAPAVPPAPCAPAGSVADRSACLAQRAQGSDLAASNALFELGMLQVDELHAGAQGVESFQTYEARFPNGALVSDAAFAALSELIAEHRSSEAQRQAELFLARFPHDARAGEVRARLQALRN
jgi:hypothetical protein